MTTHTSQIIVNILVAAATGSSDFVMLSSNVTVTCLQRESSRPLASHLGYEKILIHCS